MKEINYVFNCTIQANKLKEVCVGLTNLEDDPYAKIVGLLVTSISDIEKIANIDIPNIISRYLQDTQLGLDISFAQQIIEAAIQLFATMQNEILANGLIGMKTAFVKQIYPYIVIGVVL